MRARRWKWAPTAAINYRTEDFVEEVHALTDGEGVAVVLDMVGGDYVPRNLACLADEGRHVSIAVQRGAKAEIPIADIMRRRLTLTGSTLRPRSVEFKTMVADEIAKHGLALCRGRPAEAGRSTASSRSADAAEAHARMEAGEHVGKIVLEVGE